MRLVFAGTPAAAVPSLAALLDSTHEVVAVLSRPDAPSGRGRHPAAAPVAELARARGIETLTPRTPRDPELLARLTELAPACCPVVAYGGLIPPDLLGLPDHGWVNLHFSLLPAWRGAAPVQHAILHGDEITGATTFVLEAGLDTGPVLGTLTEEIRPDDTAGVLLDRLAAAGARLLVATLDGLDAGELVAVPQPGAGVSHAPKLSVDDARVDWSAPALRVDRLVRATTPSPGAWTTFRDRRLKLGPVRRIPDPPPLGPGEVTDLGRAGLAVGTADDAVLLGTVQPEGRAAMPAGDWARGVRLAPGERLA